jgi:hypothetical protein
VIDGSLPVPEVRSLENMVETTTETDGLPRRCRVHFLPNANRRDDRSPTLADSEARDVEATELTLPNGTREYVSDDGLSIGIRWFGEGVSRCLVTDGWSWTPDEAVRVRPAYWWVEPLSD